MTTCPAWFDGDGPSDRTHTCSLEAGHAGPHECHRCGGTWTDLDGEAES